ncbi:MAG: type II toxin-antitoxin system RelE/ParE family toxin [Candidatus Omnitrophica bacterium]|nr:type II toxin-antitoxin system RelE/ParE family toxin [Candidatus Omnitrophota bacterium]
MKKKEDKKLVWIGSALDDIREFPEDVKDDIGYALRQVQKSEKPASAKPLKGFSGASVLEIIEDYCTDTYRACCTVRFSEVVYVLHCFQKKSKKGIETPKQDIELIKRRLKVAEADYAKNYKKG